MLNNLKRSFKAILDASDFASMPRKEKRIVFYSEDTFSYMHFDRLIKLLLEKVRFPIHYLYSQYDDPISKRGLSGLKCYYIGDGGARTKILNNINADIVIMTMPDLGIYHIKRSPHKVHYVYLFHAMVSTHSNYKLGAFDLYDTIFLTSPFQENEIRRAEQIYHSPRKSVVPYGYPRLEYLMEKFNRRKIRSSNEIQVLLAPSWGNDSILDRIGEAIIDKILENPVRLIVRPHPMTQKHRPQLLNQLYHRFRDHQRFSIETDITTEDSFFHSDILITDWSGVGLEYSFSTEKPVIYVDLPQKRRNPEADLLEMVPIERSIRSRIGKIISPNHLDTIYQVIVDLKKNSAQWKNNILKAREEFVYNIENTGRGLRIGADYILNLIESTNAMSENKLSNFSHRE